MSGVDPRDPREAALRRLVRDARAEPAAELDWSRLEERLLSQTRRAAPARKRSAYPYTWGALAVAATAVLWLIGTRPQPSASPSPQANVEAPGPLQRNGDSLALGTRVEAEVREVTVDHPGRAQWTLSPSSSAVLASRDERITVQLERGSVLSRVVRNPKPETFVVEAAGTRVAVHGTVFRVTLEGGRVLVEVREGTVGVGPLGVRPAFLLKAPAHGDFAADGRSGSIDGRWVRAGEERQTGPQKAAPVRGSSASAGGSAVAPVASAELPAEPSINDIEAGIARIVDATSDCFTRHTQSADGVQITVRTALSLKILGSGAVADVDFQPPLSPDAEKCAAVSIAQVSFAASKQGAKVTRLLELKR
jgi:FecR protein